MYDNMQRDWMGYPDHMWLGNSELGWLIPILLWSIMIIGIILVAYLIVKSEGESNSEKNPLEILNERYARGEIDEEEYERRREKLEED